MYYLWIDPWVRKFWYALVDKNLEIIESWIILNTEFTVKNRLKQFEKIIKISQYISNLVDWKNILSCWVEKLYFTNYNRNNAEFVYYLRWIIIIFLIKKWVKIFEYSPKEIKKYITWNWNAKKELVKNYIKKIFNLDETPEFDDAADSLWLCYILSKK